MSNLDHFEKFATLTAEYKAALKNLDAYKMGYDCGMNGANQINCNFRIFGSPESTREWERGKEQAEIDKKKN